MARMKPLHVVIEVDTTKLDEALAAYQAAEARYFALVSGQLDCLATWEHDPPGPDYVGTRCRLLQGHVEKDGTRHRNGPIEWR